MGLIAFLCGISAEKPPTIHLLIWLTPHNGRGFTPASLCTYSVSIFGARFFCELLEWLPLETLFWETPRLAPWWAEQLSLEAADSDRRACQSLRGQAASSGIAVLSPALFTLVTLQHLELTPGMSHRQCGSQGKWPWGYQRRQTLCLRCHLSPLIVSACSMPARWRCLFQALI